MIYPIYTEFDRGVGSPPTSIAENTTEQFVKLKENHPFLKR